MNERTSRFDTPVLIAGGGPIGLALAGDLGRRGVPTLLVEERENKLNPAKMLEVSVRTMEFCRQLGVVEKVRNWGFPRDWPLDSVFVTDLQGYELGRVRIPSLAAQAHLAVSPERGMPCPQTWFDPILQEFARSFPHANLRHNTRLESFIQDADGVTATLRHRLSGRSETVRTKYLVGCDDFASTVRDLLGIEIRGEPHIDWSMTIYLRIPDLPAQHDKGKAFRYVFVGPEGELMNFLSMVERDDWQVESWTVQGTAAELANDFSGWHADVQTIIQNIDTPYKWALMVRGPMERWSKGRITLLGDACHPTLPFLGQGGVMAIEDAYVVPACLKKHFDDPGAAFARYEDIRRARTSAVVRKSRANRRQAFNPALADHDEAVISVAEEWQQTLARERLDWLYTYDATAIQI